MGEKTSLLRSGDITETRSQQPSNIAICIFVYKRNIDALLDSLLKNPEAKISDVFLFSDGPKSSRDIVQVNNVRRSLNHICGFNKVERYFSDSNKGLANSIIGGITQVFKSYDSVVVLEDDLVVSEHFLSFMYSGLIFHKDNSLIWSLSGYTPDIEAFKKKREDSLLSVRSSSWGWATWRDRWEKVDWNMSDYEQFRRCKRSKAEFALGGNDLPLMLELQKLGRIDSWAIRWCYSQFKNDAYSVLPKTSLVQNRGFRDGMGTHNRGDAKRWMVDTACRQLAINAILPRMSEIHQLKLHYDLRLKTRVGYFLKKHGGYRLAKYVFG